MVARDIQLEDAPSLLKSEAGQRFGFPKTETITEQERVLTYMNNKMSITQHVNDTAVRSFCEIRASDY